MCMCKALQQLECAFGSCEVLFTVGKPHHGLPVLDERTLAKRLLGGSYRNGDENDQPSGTSSSKLHNPLGSTSTKNLGNSAVSAC